MFCYSTYSMAPLTIRGFFWLTALAGAELGLQVPLSQVLTPKRGSTHTWRMTQTTRMPNSVRYSIRLPHDLLMPIGSTVPF